MDITEGVLVFKVGHFIKQLEIKASNITVRIFTAIFFMFGFVFLREILPFIFVFLPVCIFLFLILGSWSLINLFLIAIILVGVVLIPMCLYFSKRSFFPRNLEKFYFLVSALYLLDKIGHIEPNIKRNISKKITSARAENGGFKYLDIAFPEMSKTYLHLKTLYYLDSTTSNEKDLNWILRCENVNGGFGKWPDDFSRISTTFYALDILKRLNSLNRINEYNHINWIKNYQTESGGFQSPFHLEPTIDDTYYAIHSLSILRATDEIDKNKCTAWVMNKWRISIKNFEATDYTVHVLTLLGCLKKIEKELRMWLSLNSNYILNSRADKNYMDIYYYIQILVLVHEGKLEEIPPNLLEGLTDKLINALKK